DRRRTQALALEAVEHALEIADAELAAELIPLGTVAARAARVLRHEAAPDLRGCAHRLGRPRDIRLEPWLLRFRTGERRRLEDATLRGEAAEVGRLVADLRLEAHVHVAVADHAEGGVERHGRVGVAA